MVKVTETQKLNSRQGMPEDTATDSKTIDNTNPITWIKPFPYSITSYKNFSKFLQRTNPPRKEVFLNIHTIICILKRLRFRGKGKVQYLKEPKKFVFFKSHLTKSADIQKVKPF